MSHSTLRAKRATFTYILSGQKLVKNAKKAYDQTVLPDRSFIKRKNAKIEKIKMRHF